MTPILEARGVTKTHFGVGEPVHAVRHVDLAIAPGEFVAIMGPSGSGKSSLLHLLGGLSTPTSGEVLIGGRSWGPLSDDDRAALRRDEIGFVFQSFNLVPLLDVVENVTLPARLAGKSEEAMRSRVEELLVATGLVRHRHRQIAELSGGEQQRVAIARALVMEPTVVLADEPTGNLDSSTARQVLELLVDVHRAEQAIVLVTHDARAASQADRVLFMRDGRLAAESRLGQRHEPVDLVTRISELELGT